MATLPVANCPANHTLTQFITPVIGYYCDVCNKNVNEQTILFGCKECDYDICQKCQNMATKLPKETIHNPTSLKQSLKQLSNLSRLRNQCKISKQLFSSHVNNKLSYFNPFYSQLDTMINDMAWTTMARIPHQTQINESNISVFVDGIKCDYIPIAIKCLNIINKFAMNNAKNRNLCLQQNILHDVLPLCSATNSIQLLHRVSELYLSIILLGCDHDTSLDNKQIILMLKGISVLLYYDFDIILKPITLAYGQMLKKYSNVTDILYGGMNAAVIKKQYQQKIYDDDKLFTKSMKEYQNKFDLDIPVAVIELIRQHYDVFTENTTKNESYDNLLYRFFNLLKHPNQVIVHNTLYGIYKFIDVEPDLTIMNVFIEFGMIQMLKILHKRNNKEIQDKVCWMAELLAVNNKFDELLKDGIIYTILVSHNCDENGLLVILKGMEHGSIDEIKCVFDSELLKLMFNVLSRIFTKDEILWETDLQDSLTAVVRSIIGHNVSYIVETLRTEINSLHTNDEIIDKNKEYLAGLKEQIVD